MVNPGMVAQDFESQGNQGYRERTYLKNKKEKAWKLHVVKGIRLKTRWTKDEGFNKGGSSGYQRLRHRELVVLEKPGLG